MASYNWRAHYVARCNGGAQLPTRVGADNEAQFMALENVGRRFNVGLRMAL